MQLGRALPAVGCPAEHPPRVDPFLLEPQPPPKEGPDLGRLATGNQQPFTQPRAGGAVVLGVPVRGVMGGEAPSMRGGCRGVVPPAVLNTCQHVCEAVSGRWHSRWALTN